MNVYILNEHQKQLIEKTMKDISNIFKGDNCISQHLQPLIDRVTDITQNLQVGKVPTLDYVTLYVAEVTEYEWGCRPDGYLISNDLQKGILFSHRKYGYVSFFSGGYCEAGQWRKVTIPVDSDIAVLMERVNKAEANVVWDSKLPDIITQYLKD